MKTKRMVFSFVTSCSILCFLIVVVAFVSIKLPRPGNEAKNWITATPASTDNRDSSLDKSDTFFPQSNPRNESRVLSGEAANFGTSSITLKRAFASSTEQNRAHRAPEFAIDKDAASRWSSNYNDNEWIAVELETTSFVQCVVLHWEVAFGAQYEIETSTDGANWVTQYTETSGSGDVEAVSIPGLNTKYVRMNGKKRQTGWGFSLYEIEIQNAPCDGTPAPPTPTTNAPTPPSPSTMDPVIVRAFSSSIEFNEEIRKPDFVFDKNPGTRWASAREDNEWIAVELEEVSLVGCVILVWEHAYGKQFRLETSMNGGVWDTKYTQLDGVGGREVISLPLGTTTKFIRMYGVQRGTQYGYSLWGLEVGARRCDGATSAPTPIFTNAPTPPRNQTSKPTRSPTIPPTHKPTPVPPTDPTSRPTPLVKPIILSVSASSVEENRSYRQPKFAIDRKLDTRWSSNYDDPEWIVVELVQSTLVGCVVLRWEVAYGSRYKVETSLDGKNWVAQFVQDNGKGGSEFIPMSSTAKFVRMYGIERQTKWGYSLWEFEVLSDCSSSPPPTPRPTVGPTPPPTPRPTLHPSPRPTIGPTHPPGSVTYLPGDLSARGEGFKLSRGLDIREIARTGRNGFHAEPDGAECFPHPDGDNLGFAYVSNSEVSGGRGGVGALYFNAAGDMVGYRRLLGGTHRNCGGAATPWGSFISPEESFGGRGIWQVDPYNRRSPQLTVMGNGPDMWESFTYDNSNPDQPKFYFSSDRTDGPVGRFIPSAATITRDKSKMWDMLHDRNGEDRWLVLHGGGTYEWTSSKGAAEASARSRYSFPEGMEFHNGKLYFVSKKQHELFILDVKSMRYTARSTRRGDLRNQPDQLRFLHTSRQGDPIYPILFVTEDGGSPGIHARDLNGGWFTILEKESSGDETAGIAFSPDKMYMFFALQHEGRVFKVWRTDGRPFDDPVVRINYSSYESLPGPSSTPGDLTMKGDNGSPASSFPLGRCEGDCDRDSDCRDPYKCFQRSGQESVPGCSGSGVNAKDYCH